MFWKRKSDGVDPGKEVSIHARLHSGETLQITFTHDGAPRQLRIEGRGDIRLAVRSDADVTAELLGEQRHAGEDTLRSRRAT